jgi:ABC-type phosphate transport system substrate-binding protein
VPNLLRRHRRAGFIGGVTVLAASVASLSLAGIAPAGASNLPPGNTIVIGSGSQTAYELMTGLENLYNGSQGCNEIAATGETQSLSFNCPSGTSISTADNVAAQDTGENPVNDVAIQEPPLGGSNGLKQLEGQVPVLCTPSAASCTSSEPINFATTVRNPLTSDPIGLNFVNFADDALSWFHFTKVVGVATPSSAVTNLTTPELQSIWEGNTTNWNKLPGGKSGPICVYVTNTGAGVYSVWQTALDIPALNSYVNGLTTLKGCGGAGNYAATHTIEQNEDSQIIANGDEKDAIFFFSSARYQQTCLTVCGGTKPPGTTASKASPAKLGEINSVAITNNNILTGQWPAIVYLSTVYSNGVSGSTIPVASQATLNFASEQGFLCDPQTSGGNDIIDPVTGVWYRTEIQNLLTSEFFVPIESTVASGGSGPEPENTVDTPAVLNSPYNQAGQTSGVDPSGYCLVSTTDGS